MEKYIGHNLTIAYGIFLQTRKYAITGVLSASFGIQ